MILFPLFNMCTMLSCRITAGVCACGCRWDGGGTHMAIHRMDARRWFRPSWMFTLIVHVRCCWQGRIKRPLMRCVLHGVPAISTFSCVISCDNCNDWLGKYKFIWPQFFHWLSLSSMWMFSSRNSLVAADVCGRRQRVCFTFKPTQGGRWTALIYAAADGLADCVRLLIDAGASKEAKKEVCRMWNT